jgi:hypothetical protein
MNIVGQLAEALQTISGPSLEELGRQTGAIRRRRKFTGSSLLMTLVLTLLRVPRPKGSDYVTTAAWLGLRLTERAIAKRFTPPLARFARAALGRLLGRAFAAAPVAVPLLEKFRGVFVGDGTAVALPDVAADEFPGRGGKSGSGQATLKVQLRWNLSTGELAELALEPGRHPDARSAIVSHAPPAQSLSIYDLGYFDLARLRRWDARGAFWISRLQPGTTVFDEGGPPIALLALLREHPRGAPLDRVVLVGAAERLRCRLIAIRVPAEVAARRRQKAYQRAGKHGTVPSANLLAGCDWTVFVTNCPADLLTWKEVVILYRMRWQIELVFKLWKSHNLLATPPPDASPERWMAELWAKLIGVVLQHWMLLATTWPSVRRSLWKAAGVIRDGIPALIGAWDDRDRLVQALSRLRAAIAAVARVNTRTKRPSLHQMLLNPDLLEWGC